MGGGGGSDTELFSVQEAPAATEAPLEAPMAAVPAETETAMDASEGEPSVALVPAATQTPPTEDATRIMETPVLKNGETENSVAQGQPQVPDEAPSPQLIPPLISSVWQIVLAVVAVLRALFMTLMRQLSARRWK